jgi:hypothetical protein
MNVPEPTRIPVLSGVTSRCVALDELHEFSDFLSSSSRNSHFLQDGSICAAAIAEDKVGAVAWARLGPRECVVDDSYSHGFRWQLEADEAWLHNGEARADLQGTGVYLSAFRRLLEELDARGVVRCYGHIAEHNAASLSAHRRLGLRQLATLHYTRVAGVGFYRWRSPLCSGSVWTFKRSLRLRPADFL